jgi:alkylation response protein AidB-like acyl-CoA dehydrogenase
VSPGPGLIPTAVSRAAAAQADASEQAGRLAPQLLRALANADLFRICVPRVLGGREATPLEVAAAIEELSQVDGSAGWSLMIAATSGLLAGWLPARTARQIFESADSPCGGVFAPRGRAVARRGGGMTVTGRWPFCSGVTHAAWMLAGCVVADGERRRLLPNGSPDVYVVALARPQIEILETWSVTGLRATGSHDMTADGVVVPRGRSVSLFTGRPVQDGPLYRFPIFGLLAIGVAAVGLGIARGALADFVTLAAAKTPTLSRRPLSEHPSAQAAAATAWARLRAARALLREAIEDAWDEVQERRQVSLPHRAALRVAATHAAAESAAVVDAVQRAAGGSAIYTASPLERRFRDIHTLTAHMMVGPSTWELAGRVLLGAEVDATML